MNFLPAIGSSLPLIGKRREPSVREVDGNLRIAPHAVCGKYNLIHSPESRTSYNSKKSVNTMKNVGNDSSLDYKVRLILLLTYCHYIIWFEFLYVFQSENFKILNDISMTNSNTISLVPPLKGTSSVMECTATY